MVGSRGECWIGAEWVDVGRIVGCGRGGVSCVLPLCIHLKCVHRQTVTCHLWLDSLIGFAGQWAKQH